LYRISSIGENFTISLLLNSKYFQWLTIGAGIASPNVRESEMSVVEDVQGKEKAGAVFDDAPKQYERLPEGRKEK
jgi:hypothetical protein